MEKNGKKIIIVFLIALVALAVIILWAGFLRADKNDISFQTDSINLPESAENKPEENEGSKNNEENWLLNRLFSIDHVPSPKAAAFSPDGTEIWVTLLLNKEKGVSVFDAKTGNKIKDVNLQNGGGVEVIFSKDGSRAYVSQMETARVFEIDAQTKEVLRFFDAKSSWTKILAISDDGKTLFASNWVGDDISEFDLETGKLKRLIATVDTPRGLYPTKDGKFLYVAGFENGEIEKIDLETGLGKIIYKSNGAMRHIVADEEKGILYFSEMAKAVILKLDLQTDIVSEFAATDTNPNTIALSPDKKVLFVSCRGANATADNYYIPGPEWGSVLAFDAESGEMLDAIVGGNQPTALDVSPDGTMLVFSNFLDNQLEIFSIPSYEVLKSGNGGRSAVYKAELEK